MSGGELDGSYNGAVGQLRRTLEAIRLTGCSTKRTFGEEVHALPKAAAQSKVELGLR
jgi:hypothetical protein